MGRAPERSRRGKEATFARHQATFEGHQCASARYQRTSRRNEGATLCKEVRVFPRLDDGLNVARAAAWAETGQFNKAVENARKAAQLAEAQGNRQAAQTYRQRLQRYLKAQTLSP